MCAAAGRAGGWTCVAASRALVWEELTVERATYRWQLRRRLWYGNTEAVTSVTSGEATRARVAVRGVRCIVEAVVRPLRRVVSGSSPQLRFAVAEVLRGVGRLLGASGVWLRHH